LEPVCSDK
jgi:hypothetical protein